METESHYDNLRFTQKILWVLVIWKRGESNNFYLGLYVVGERSDFYNSLITKSIFDPIKIFD